MRIVIADWFFPAHCKFLFQMIDVLLQEETLLNVVRSVTRNWRSIIITAILALVLVYFFSIIGFIFFKEDFLIETEPVAVAAGKNFFLSIKRKK